MRFVLVAGAGAAGALARYAVALAAGTQRFPWPTMAINVAGCFLLGLLLHSDRFSADTTTVLAVGFLGAFTTFSTFGYETVALLRSERAAAALAYAGLSVGLGVGAAALGWSAGRLLSS